MLIVVLLVDFVGLSFLLLLVAVMKCVQALAHPNQVFRQEVKAFSHVRDAFIDSFVRSLLLKRVLLRIDIDG